MIKKLTEATSTPAKIGNRWKVVLAVPGQGMSGYYSKEVLREQGPSAIPPGTKAFIGHSAPDKRDPRDQLGKYPDGAYYDENIDPIAYPDGALVSELEVFDRYKQMIEEIGTDAELSIYVDGDTDSDGNVISMLPGRSNSVDLVSFAGLSGSGLREKMYESLRDLDEPSDRPSALDEKREVMLDKETLDAIAASVKSVLADLAEAPKVKTEAEVQAEIDSKVEAEVGAKVDAALAGYEEKVVAIEAAELLPSQVESLKAEARKGVDVAPLIESAKAVVSEFKTLSESFDGVRINDVANNSDDYSVSRWND